MQGSKRDTDVKTENRNVKLSKDNYHQNRT